eukprot:PhM_4_TR12047/c0_g1_i1/m.4688
MVTLSRFVLGMLLLLAISGYPASATSSYYSSRSIVTQELLKCEFDSARANASASAEETLCRLDALSDAAGGNNNNNSMSSCFYTALLYGAPHYYASAGTNAFEFCEGVCDGGCVMGSLVAFFQNSTGAELAWTTEARLCEETECRYYYRRAAGYVFGVNASSRFCTGHTFQHDCSRGVLEGVVLRNLLPRMCGTAADIQEGLEIARQGCAPLFVGYNFTDGDDDRLVDRCAVALGQVARYCRKPAMQICRVLPGGETTAAVCETAYLDSAPSATLPELCVGKNTSGWVALHNKGQCRTNNGNDNGLSAQFENVDVLLAPKSGAGYVLANAAVMCLLFIPFAVVGFMWWRRLRQGVEGFRRVDPTYPHAEENAAHQHEHGGGGSCDAVVPQPRVDIELREM